MKDINPSSGPDIMPEAVNGAVIPLHPTFDKLAALWIIQKVLGRRLRVVSHSNTDPKDPVLVEYKAKGYYLVDVGENKYQARRTGSAVETVCRDFQVTDRTLLSLVAVANHNNQKGYLKGYSPANDSNIGEEWKFDIRFGNAPDEVEQLTTKSSSANWSAVWLLREAYKVGVDVNQVIKHVHSVLDAWYEVINGNIDESRWNRRVAQNGRIKTLWNVFGNPRLKNGKGEFLLPSFSVPWLVWSLGVLGEDQLEASSVRIEHEVQWWISVQKAVVKLRAEVKYQAFAKTNPDHMRRLRAEGQVFELAQAADITVGYFPANEIMARELWPQLADADEIDRLLGAIFGHKKLAGPVFGLLVLRNPDTKRVAIMAGRERLDLGEVYARLTGLERQKRNEEKGAATKVWHFDRKGQPGQERHWLLNGSDNWPLPPTVLDIPTILEIVWKSAKRFK